MDADGCNSGHVTSPWVWLVGMLVYWNIHIIIVIGSDEAKSEGIAERAFKDIKFPKIWKK